MSISELRTAMTRTLALPQALALLGEKASDRTSARISVSTTGKPKSLTPEVYEHIERIASEALSNAVQHAGASTIELELSYVRKGLELAVRDDGRGMDSSTVDQGRAGHWGLLGMRERAKAMGGRIKIYSKPGAGSEVHLLVPASTAFAGHAGRQHWPNIFGRRD